MNKRYYEHTLPIIRGSLSNTYALKGECMEKKRICQALEKAGHNRKEAARLLGISRSTLYEKMDLYGIQTKR